MANRKPLSKEVKIGVTAIVALALLIYGANFLKGIDLFSPTNTYYLKYDNMDGLVVSNGVFVRGYKVGQVKDIRYDFESEHPFTVEIIVNDDIRLPKGTIAYLYDASMLGGKGINLVFGDSRDSHSPGDTLTTDVEIGLVGQISEIVPDIKATVRHADSLVVSMNNVVNSPEIANGLKSFEAVMADLRNTSARLNYFMDVKFPPIVEDIKGVTSDVHKISSQLTATDYARIMTGLDTSIQNVRQLTERINSNEGTLGKLLNDNSLYNNVDSTVCSANALIIDLKQNPKRYVHFSLCGPKEDKKKK